MGSQEVIWVTGAEGFLGGAVSEHLREAGWKVVGTDAELSVSDPERLERFAGEVMPAAVVNCAGIRRDATTLSTRIKAYEVNALGARNVAVAANAVGALMVQVSSDDVYAAVVPEPVNEFDNPHPTTPYGKSKRAGEMMVRNTTDDHLIVRSSWLYRADSGRFKDILDAAREGRTYAARTDQVASPTSVDFYCKFLEKALEKRLTGTFHVANTGSTSRYGFAAKILELAGYDPSAVLVAEEDPRTAEHLVLESLLLEMSGVDIPAWDDELARYMATL
ncbi:SDR family oxidoreductase [Adlercreutzia faecimuris]|uniref:dTDP-4-dehydrorhamnose reductase n=1 Tax=Adlercreutzia faecimuris TaxID=2897341 RepID=A0ABS9WFX7_9ACTN|nr:sugar nucleotide-binding protein [Adlercreutzia sp. JBNU-10]MCI2241222.1 sugar nucleotide-binding protein [Adlercreutzia sp. JBNU-10]